MEDLQALASPILDWIAAGGRMGQAATAGFALIALLLLRTLPALRRARRELRAAQDVAQSRRGEVETLRADARVAEAEMRHLEHRLEEREAALADAEALRDEARRESVARAERIAELQTGRQKDREAAEEKIALLSGIREDMAARFKALADETMKSQGEALSASHKERLEALLNPFRENVGKFERELREVHLGAAKERERLKTEIEQLTRRSEQVSQEAVALTRALKGDKQRQGAWGEMILSSLLESSGLVEGEHYEVQAHRMDEEGGRRRPDVLVRMPGGRTLVIDSKVSLIAYEAAANAESQEARERAADEHVVAVRRHIDQLSARRYQELEARTLDYVVMFLPVEGALSEALRRQGDLTGYALEKQVTIATPTTLMMALRTIENVWAAERRNRNAEAIAERAGRLYDKVAGFVTEMDAVGQRLDQAQAAHGKALDRLSRGRGNVLAQVDMLRRLGAKASRSLPEEGFDAEEEDAEALPAPGGEDGLDDDGAGAVGWRPAAE